ncbi:unnamed protein product, partial [Heligmosomoides polygyrus]|uniref:Cadherin_C domain-containing protein n=1 Tax=Heligmosomoides polygyrus TaxID=6339 RepID=A0A183GS55_HELPZ
SYYSEEKTFSASAYPAKPTRNPPISQTKLSGRGLKDLDDHDIDGLLSNLSIEELEDLNNDFDPDKGDAGDTNPRRDDHEAPLLQLRSTYHNQHKALVPPW